MPARPEREEFDFIEAKDAALLICVRNVLLADSTVDPRPTAKALNHFNQSNLPSKETIDSLIIIAEPSEKKQGLRTNDAQNTKMNQNKSIPF